MNEGFDTRNIRQIPTNENQRFVDEKCQTNRFDDSKRVQACARPFPVLANNDSD